MGPYKAVFIDFDGTLVDSLPELYGVYCDFLKLYGHLGTVAEFQELNGPSISEIVVILAQRYQLPHALETLKERYWEVLRTFYGSKAKPMPGALEGIAKLSSRGYRLGLVTAASRDLVDAFLPRYSLDRVFDSITTSDGLANCKPHPEIYFKALDALQISPTEAIAIEDSPSGIQAALSAGLFALRLNVKATHLTKFPGYIEVTTWAEIQKQLNL